MGKPYRQGVVVIGAETRNVSRATAALLDLGTAEAAKLPSYNPTAPREERLRTLRALVAAGKGV